MSVLKQLVKLEATKTFMKLLMESKTAGTPDALVNELLFVLGQLSQKGKWHRTKRVPFSLKSNCRVKDGKFAKHAETLSAAKTFHQQLKSNVKNVKLITPLLMCFKTLTKNGSSSICFFISLVIYARAPKRTHAEGDVRSIPTDFG